MNRNYLITAIGLLMSTLSHAQDLDIKPSQQAQGILESKNAMVDHATGLFHYKVPLYEVKSGNFTLPISLNYVAKGVKVNDTPGLIDYNWTLNTGGVVTRTLRGGIPDEDKEKGYIYNNYENTPAEEMEKEVELVNKREKDGETDIFTASFNGQTVNFFIKKDGNNLLAIPFQRTNTRIEIVQNSINSGTIDGWIITDGNGTKYTFMQKEFTTNAIKEFSVSANGIINKSFISSWYLNKIEPVNCKPIIYNYLADVSANSKEKVKFTYYGNNTTIKYNYGKPIYDRPINFSKYSSDFFSEIEMGFSFLGMYTTDTQLEARKYEINKFGHLMENPYYESILGLSSQNFKIMGMYSNFNVIQDITDIPYDNLNAIIYLYKDNPDINVKKAIYCFQHAKEILAQCLSEIEIIDTKEQSLKSGFTVKSPILTEIHYDNKSLLFSYENDEIVEISLYNLYRNKINSIKFNTYPNNLNQISYVDSNNIEYDNLKFYYYNVDNTYNATDLWGYRRKRIYPTGNIDDKYLPYVDADGAKHKSLYKIVQSSNASIELDYESNMSNTNQYDYYNAGFGGIRLKEIIIKDDNGTSTIKYSYPVNGVYVYPYCQNTETVHYYDFNDNLEYSSIMNIGNAWINFGNNGLYYPYVKEEFVGKGTVAYEFYINMDNISYYWLAGLPLSKATYDKDNRLKSVVKYNYYSSDFDYTVDTIKELSQIKAYQHYIDEAKVEQEFANNRDLYENVYVKNIKPRVSTDLTFVTDFPYHKYGLYYGGRTVLKEQIEYLFEESSSVIPSINDFTKVSPRFNKIEYVYNNIDTDIYPLKQIKYNTDGSKYIEETKRVVDITDNQTMINDMKARNMLNIPIKIQKQVVNNNNSELIEEKVYKYIKNTIDNCEFISLDKIYSYVPKSNRNILSNNNMFSYNISDYDIESISYKYNKGNYLLSHSAKLNESNFYDYDFVTKDIIFKSNNIENNSVLCFDYRRLKSIDVLTEGFDFETIKNLYQKFLKSDFRNSSPELKEYVKSSTFLSIMDVLKNFTESSRRVPYNNFKESIGKYITEDNIFNLQLIFYASYNNYGDIGELEVSDLDGMHILFFLNDITESAYNNLFMYDYLDLIDKQDLKLTNVMQNKNYKLYVISFNKVQPYTVDYFINNDFKSVLLPRTQYPILSVFDINLENYSSVNEISIPVKYDSPVYIALVPSDCEFEATSYNSDGTIFCKFNQNGQMERYEYDAAGRPIKIFDQDGNLLKEMKYNKVLN